MTDLSTDSLLEREPDAALPATGIDRGRRRFASLARWYWLAPLFAIVLFIAVMLAVFFTLRYDELDRQHQALYRDVESIQQAMVARLSVSQEEVAEIAHDFETSGDAHALVANARALLRTQRSLMSIAWIDPQRVWQHVVVSDVLFDGGPREEGDALENAVSRVAFDAARDRNQPRYSAAYAAPDGDMYVELHVPMFKDGTFHGTVVAVTSLASLARLSDPNDPSSSTNLALVDANGKRLAGLLGPGKAPDAKLGEQSVILALGAPLPDLYLRATAFRTRSQLANNFLVWAVVALSLLIVWTLFSQMRHLRGRQEAEAARDRIFNLSLDILAVLDRHGHIARLNPACARILGRDPDELQGVSLLDLVHPDDREATGVQLQRIVDGGIGSAFENRCRRFNPDGTTEYRWLVWNFNPDLQARGDKRLLYAVAHDITQRRARQQALLAETTFRRAMEDSMLTGMRVLDMGGRITYVNPAFCRMLGYSERELLGATPPFPYWPKNRVEDSRASLREILAGRTPPSGLEVRVERRDGAFLDTRMYVSPLIDANGVQSGWMTSMTDITQSKRARQELAAAQERFTTVLDELDAAVSVCSLLDDPPAVAADRDDDPAGTPHQWPLLFANRHYQHLFGVDAAGHRALNAARSRLAASEDDELSREVYSAQADRWFEVRTRTIQWVDGSPVRMQVATDITGRVDARERTRQQEEKVQLTSRLITMGEMASSLAHELNQPLTAITNYSMGTVARVRRNIATGATTDPIELLGMLQKTSAQAERAGHIIRRIREFVKRSEPHRRRCSIRAIVDDAVGFAEIDAAKKRIAIRTDVPADIADIDADAILVEQVLLNLIRNGCEATVDARMHQQVHASGRLVGGDRTIVVAVRDVHDDGSSGHVEFAVIDRGHGIATEDAEKLFEPFFSTKAEGMGMGLNICRSIVEFHRGRLWAAPNPDGGTIFRFTIPRVPCDPPTASEDARTEAEVTGR